ncbi:MAG TPA: pentapeptide repeat-containing protein [bacterium]|jgi:uncharacterized protein YjbI with pentapeptide repeats
MTSSKCASGCGRDVYDNANYPTNKCIFHSEKKDSAEFYEEIGNLVHSVQQYWNAPCSFNGFVFPDCPNPRTLVEILGRSHAGIFCLDFSGAVFEGRIDLSGYHFQAGLTFERATFKCDALFDGSNMPLGVSFAGTTFEGLTRFVGTFFQANANFQGAKFRQSSFESATFKGQVTFLKVFFAEPASFCKAKVAGCGVWSRSEFLDTADMSCMVFSDRALFQDTIFHNIASFHSAKFKGEVRFDNALFREDVSFSRVSFEDHAHFAETKLARGLNLGYASFAVLGDFSRCKIISRVRLTWPGEGAKREPAEHQTAEVRRGILQFKSPNFGVRGLLDIRDNMLQPDCSLHLVDCDMAKVLLQGTDCRMVRFKYCRWPKVTHRQVVGDEYRARKHFRSLRTVLVRILPFARALMNHPRLTFALMFRPKEVNWPRIITIYQELVDNCREIHDYRRVNDFDRGIFEARRMIAKSRGRRGISDYLLLSTYRSVSAYSGSLLKPVIWLVASTLAYAYFYWGNSYAIDAETGLLSDFIKKSVQIASLNRIGFEFARANSLAVNVLIALQVVTTTGLVALLLFSIRRRFKH